MVIYITSEQHKDLLTRMGERYEWELIVEVMEKGSLNTYITDSLQVIGSIRYLVIERSCIKENEQQLRELLDTILAIWNPQIILLEEILQDDDGEFQKVIYRDNITSLYKYQDNLEVNIEYLLKGEKIPAENVYSGTWIGVMSANSGAGCTHVAIHLANYISNHGQSVCYVEANESGDLGAMAPFYDFEKIGDNHYRKDSVDYWHQMIDPEKKFAVLDIGKYSASKMEMFNQCKIKVLVSDGKPYRMADAVNVLHYLNDNSVRLWLNYLPDQEEEYERLQELYLSAVMNPVGRLTWHKSMFCDEDALYQDALQSYIHIAAKKTSKFAFIIKADALKDKLQRRVERKSQADESNDLVSEEGDEEDETNIPVVEMNDMGYVEALQKPDALMDFKEETLGELDEKCTPDETHVVEEDNMTLHPDDYADLEQEVIVVRNPKSLSKSRLTKNIMSFIIIGVHRNIYSCQVKGSYCITCDLKTSG